MPASITSGMFVKILMTCPGSRKATRKKITPMQKFIVSAKPVVLRMFKKSPLPKNCAMNVAFPLEKPKTSIQKTKNICRETPTALSASSPSPPIMRLSIRLRLDAIRLCKAIGPAMRPTFFIIVLLSIVLRFSDIYSFLFACSAAFASASAASSSAMLTAFCSVFVTGASGSSFSIL